MNVITGYKVKQLQEKEQRIHLKLLLKQLAFFLLCYS